MNKINLLIILLVLVVLGASFWFFQSQIQQPPLPQPAQVTQTPEVNPLDSTSSGSQVINEDTLAVTVEGNEYAFTPETLNLQSGQKVKLTFKNTGKLPHNLLIDELGVATKTIGGGKEGTIEFTVSKTGTFSMYCSVGDHKSRGMEGNVSVL